MYLALLCFDGGLVGWDRMGGGFGRVDLCMYICLSLWYGVYRLVCGRMGWKDGRCVCRGYISSPNLGLGIIVPGRERE